MKWYLSPFRLSREALTKEKRGDRFGEVFPQGMGCEKSLVGTGVKA
jgi:hypothetical protein